MKPKDLTTYYPSQRAAAKAIGVSKQAVSQWKRLRTIPLEQQLEFERVTNGALRADLPDFVRPKAAA